MDKHHHEEHDHSEEPVLEERLSSEMKTHESHSDHAGHHEHETEPVKTLPMEHHDQTGHDAPQAGDSHDEHKDHGAHVDHRGHEEMFRNRFWICLLLSIPVY